MRAAPTAYLGREFDGFLFAPIGEDANGMVLSVLSVLARLNVDPWREASKIAELPREAAIGHLATLLRKTTDASCGERDPMAIARRLVSLLPAKSQLSPQLPGVQLLIRSPLAMALMYAVFVGLVFGGQYLLGNMTSTPPATASSPVEPSQAAKAARQ
jgi:hypothetical protein